ncbi:MAG TPA: hypothetical protein VLE95_04710 [Chlamydiales bacterium]|nr:hypothetical protein [Chlamydiales bacterium]
MEGSYLEGELGKEAAIGVAKVALGLVPGVGPLLVEAFFETPSRLVQNRRDEYIDAVLKNLAQVQESLIDIDYLKSEDFSDLLQHIARKVMIRKAKERADFFARLSAANALTTRPTASVGWQFQFVEILADLNDSEMYLLLALDKHPSPSGASLSGISPPFGFDNKAEFQLCFDSLLSKGLVYDASLSGLPKLGVGHNPTPRERIDISPLGKKIIQFTKEVDTIMERALKKF